MLLRGILGAEIMSANVETDPGSGSWNNSVLVCSHGDHTESDSCVCVCVFASAFCLRERLDC